MTMTTAAVAPRLKLRITASRTGKDVKHFLKTSSSLSTHSLSWQLDVQPQNINNHLHHQQHCQHCQNYIIIHHRHHCSRLALWESEAASTFHLWLGEPFLCLPHHPHHRCCHHRCSHHRCHRCHCCHHHHHHYHHHQLSNLIEGIFFITPFADNCFTSFDDEYELQKFATCIVSSKHKFGFI